MPTIKGTLRHSSRRGGEKWGLRGIVQRFKRYILSVLKAQQGRERRKQNKRAKMKEFVPYP